MTVRSASSKTLSNPVFTINLATGPRQLIKFHIGTIQDTVGNLWAISKFIALVNSDPPFIRSTSDHHLQWCKVVHNVVLKLPSVGLESILRQGTRLVGLVALCGVYIVGRNPPQEHSQICYLESFQISLMVASKFWCFILP